LRICYTLNVVKKRSINISVLSIAFSVMLLVVSSGAKAETQDGPKKDLVSVLRIEATSLPGTKDNIGERKDHATNHLLELFDPVKAGLNAFLDLTTRPHPDLGPEDSRKAYRAVVGLSFPL
jgi:hypothetical protein